MDGSQTDYAVPGALNIVSGSDGDLYVSTSASTIVRVTPGGATTSFSIRGVGNGLVRAPDHNVWFTESVPAGQTLASIGKITPQGQVVEYYVSTPNTSTMGITIGSDGNIWFTEYEGCAIGKADIQSGTIVEYKLPSQGCYPGGIASAIDGTLWFTTNVDYLGKFFTSGSFGGSIETHLWSVVAAQVIRAGPDGSIWFVAASQSQAAWYVCRLTPAGVIVSHQIPWSMSGLSSVGPGPDGNLWIANQGLGQVDVFVLRVLSVSPASLTLAVGGSSLLTVSEKHYPGTWTATSSNPAVATVQTGSQANKFNVTGNSVGTAVITIADFKGNSFPVPVSVK